MNQELWWAPPDLFLGPQWVHYAADNRAALGSIYNSEPPLCLLGMKTNSSPSITPPHPQQWNKKKKERSSKMIYSVCLLIHSICTSSENKLNVQKKRMKKQWFNMKRRKHTEILMLKVQNNFICDTRLHCISRKANVNKPQKPDQTTAPKKKFKKGCKRSLSKSKNTWAIAGGRAEGAENWKDAQKTTFNFDCCCFWRVVSHIKKNWSNMTSESCVSLTIVLLKQTIHKT